MLSLLGIGISDIHFCMYGFFKNAREEFRPTWSPHMVNGDFHALFYYENNASKDVLLYIVLHWAITSGSTLNSLKSVEMCSVLESCHKALLNSFFILICKLFDNFFSLKFPRKSSCGWRNGPKTCRWHFHKWYQQSPWWHGCQRIPKMAD